jgi:4-coumarate--CoA ligase (photoactive yellow protein activation family)
MRAELARLRPDLPVSSAPWDAGASFDCGPLVLDSLDRLKLASAVATALHFSSATVPDRLREAPTFGDWVSEARRVAERSDGAVAFKSSGSSGAPSSVLHAITVLDEEIAALAELLAPRTRIVTAVPAHHIYGFLFTVLLPHVLKCTVLDVRRHSPAALGAVLQPGDLLVAFPTVWEAAVEARTRWPDRVAGVSSGAALRPGLFPELRLGGLDLLLEIYGSTETGGIGWRTDGAAPFRLFRHWSRLDNDRLLKASGEYALPDAAAWVDSLHLVPGPRHDRALQVGGVNVHPSRVRSVLLAHGGVADAAVRLMRAEEGERLKAFIVPKDPDADPRRLRGSLVEWVDTRLAVVERPRSFTFGAAVPINAAGKPADWPLEPAAGS